MSKLEIHFILCLTDWMDNYAYLLRDTETNITGVVDPSESEPVLRVLRERCWSLDYILNTHHHWDHTGGNEDLKKDTHCKIIGAGHDAARIPGLDIGVSDGDIVPFGRTQAHILEIPGHTSGHIAYYFAEDKALFCGDTLFSLGCGRVFEGTYEQMWHSLDKLRCLPDDTLIYCGHEYTLKNARFALHVDPDNLILQARYQGAQAKRAQGKPSIPSTLAEEKAANPFLRPEDPKIQAFCGESDPIAIFRVLRQQKDLF